MEVLEGEERNAQGLEWGEGEDGQKGWRIEEITMTRTIWVEYYTLSSLSSPTKATFSMLLSLVW